ncbi:MAG: GPR endopeptidase [Clostridia bacterium]|nr:GPR endopeptidase [Clostridia bacterium]
MPSVRTDLAMENIGENPSLPGVDVHRWEENDIQLSEVLIRTEEAARQLGKPCGSYLTMECRLLCEHDPDARIAMANLLGEELSRLLEPSDGAPVLVVGLGNRDVTPDSLGPAAVDKTLVTRHMLSSEYAAANLRSVCAIAPGVLGVTGIETVEMVESLARKLHPRAVLCIDSLAARDSARIGCTVQISNTGIQPGSGVGNHRRPLTRDTLGVEVIAVGVPTVIYAATLAKDAFALLAGSSEQEHEEALQAMEHELLDTELGNLIVTPRDIDAIVKNCATMIAGGINRALQPGLTSAEIAEMMD